MLKRYLKRRDNPWELFAIACLFLGPGIGLIAQHGPVLLHSQSIRALAYRTVLTPVQAHVFGWWAVAVAAVAIALYFYARLTADVPESPSDATAFQHHHAGSDELPLAYGSTRSPIPVFERLRLWWRRSS